MSYPAERSPSTIRRLEPGEARPDGEPRRYVNSAGYVRLRWKVASRRYVETYERDGTGSLVREPGYAKSVKRIDGATATALYKSGRTMAEIADVMGCNQAALSRVLRRAGVVTRPATSYRHPPVEDLSEIVRLYTLEGLGKQQIARRAGIGTGRVNEALRRAGIPSRRPGRVTGSRSGLTFETEFKRIRPRIEQRSKGRCEAVASDGCAGTAGHVHHRKPRGRQGDNSEANLLHVCAECHIWIHWHPERATALGLLVHTWDDPALIPIGPQTDG